MKRSLTSVATAAALLIAGTHGVLAAEQISVLHWWTSGGESKAIRVLKDDMSKQGYEWKDFAIAGGAGAAAMTARSNEPALSTSFAPLVANMCARRS